jgi:malate dehydrogenase
MSSRIAIVGGGGGVGASLAFNLLLADEPYEVALVDGRSGMAVSHEMDLQQVVAQGASGSVEIVGLDAIAGADVVVISASVPLTVNDSRMVYLRDNARIVTEIGSALRDGWPGVALMVTNPVDPLCTLLHQRGGLDRLRLIGYTANDSLRLRTGIAEQLDVRSSAVDAWVLGEHGDHFVPLFDRVRVDGEPVTLDPAQAEAAERFVRHWYETHVALDSGRSSTWTTGRGLARMVAALTRDEGELWPISVVLEGEYGVDGVALTVPATIGRGGVHTLHQWDLTEQQQAGMHRAAFAVREALYSVA